jgi:RNA polymerase sigma factor (sigma-70 family)
VIRDTARPSQAANTAREINNAEECWGVTSLCHIEEPSRHRKYPVPRIHAARTHVPRSHVPRSHVPRTHELDDLLTAVGANRDGAAFSALFDHFRPRVHAQMLRLGLAPFAAADVTQDVMETIWCKAHLFDRRKSAAATWVFRIAQNRRVDVRRRSREHVYADADLSAIPDTATDNDASIDAAQCEQHVHAALDALPQDQFKMVQLAFFEGLSHSTIAARTKIPIGTVKSRLRLAFSRLRRVLTDAGVRAA